MAGCLDSFGGEGPLECFREFGHTRTPLFRLFVAVLQAGVGVPHAADRSELDPINVA
jgi:hypothetical protein